MDTEQIKNVLGEFIGRKITDKLIEEMSEALTNAELADSVEAKMLNATDISLLVKKDQWTHTFTVRAAGN